MLVQTAENGHEAMHALDSGGQFDALLVDLHTPVMSGRDLIELVRSSDRHSHLPIVATSGAGEDSLRAAIHAGCDFFIPKPFQLRDLVEIMNAAVLGTHHAVH